jgi:hypothetical protein
MWAVTMLWQRLRMQSKFSVADLQTIEAGTKICLCGILIEPYPIPPTANRIVLAATLRWTTIGQPAPRAASGDVADSGANDAEPLGDPTLRVACLPQQGVGE